MSPHRATTPSHDRDDRIPLRVMGLERDLAAHVATCRDCRRNRERWEGAMATEFADFRAQISSDMIAIGKSLIAGLERLEKRLDAGPGVKARKVSR